MRKNKHKKSKHGLCDTVEYTAWCLMRSRCNNPKNFKYPSYGGRGIKVCERWDSFECFLEDMGIRPSKNHSLDRIDNNGNYEPLNCRWADSITQAYNRRNNVNYLYKGELIKVVDFKKYSSVPIKLIYLRLRHGWDIEKALKEPVRHKIKK